MIRSLLAALVLSVSFFGVAPVVQASEPLTPRAAAELLFSSVVRMTTGGSNLCSASKIGPATFLTAAHCARAFRDNYRVESGGSGWNYQFIGSITITVSEKDDGNRHEDWAILYATTENENLHALELACNEDIYLGMPVAYAGFPDPVDFAFSLGYVASVNKLDNRINNADFAVDLQAAPGASGSPIISLDSGKIIGILIEGVPDARGRFFLVGIESIRSLDLCEGKTGEPKKPNASINSPF